MLDTTIQGMPCNAGSLRPLRDCQRQPVHGHHVVVSPVVCLLASCGPAAVFGFVISVIVDAVYRPAMWALAHIARKLFKRAFPLIAHSDTTTTVCLEANRSRPVASGNHVFPASILAQHRGFRERMRLCSTRLYSIGFPSFLTKASATAGLASHETGRFNAFRCPAIAQAQPDRSAAAVASIKVDNDQASEPLSRKIFSAHWLRMDDSYT